MKILFLCKGNRYRSPIAAALFNQLYPEHKAISAGTNIKNENEHYPVETIQTLIKENIDVSKEKTKLVKEDIIKKMDKIIVLCNKEYCPNFIISSKKTEYWVVKDPERESIPDIEITKLIIKEKLMNFLNYKKI